MHSCGAVMGRTRFEEALVRRWRLIELLAEHDEGVTVRWLVPQIGASQATVYRDIATLRQAGVPIDVDPVEGETLYRLTEDGAREAGLTPLQFAALRLVRQSLPALEGTSLVEELDALTQRAS